MKRDQKFFDMYSLVIGILALFALAIFVFAMKLSDLTQGIYTTDADEFQAAVTDRIKPFGQVYLPGEEAQANAPKVDPAKPPQPVATAMTGPQVYNAACIACHGGGIGGAPVLQASAWQDRIPQGNDTLYRHAIEGYTGSVGYMPPKGGRLDLSDGEIRAAVDYMIAQSTN